MIRGIDVAVPQGNLSLGDWRKVAQSGVRFAIIKCGDGNNGIDPRFEQNVTGARAVGLAVGLYNVGFPLPNDGVHANRDAASQALFHHRACKGVSEAAGDLPPMLDFEWPTPDKWKQFGVEASYALRWGLEYLQAMNTLWGRTPGIYTMPWMFNAVAAGGDAQAYTNYPLWLARYEAQEPGTLAPWPRPTLWQSSDGGGVLPNGCRVDEDAFLGEEQEWKAFLGLAPLTNPLAGVPVPGLEIPGANAPTEG